MKKILIIDDEQPIRDLLQLLVESEFDNEIILADCGNAAIDILANDSEIGIILSDYNMPNGNGGLVYIYNNEGPNLPFLLVTGGFLEDYPEMVGFLEDDSYYRNVISKPFEEDFLYDEIRKGLGQTSEKVSPADISEYAKVDIDIYLRLLKRYCLTLDIFLKIGSEKIIKISDSHDTVVEADLLKYKKKENHEIMLKRSDFESLKQKALTIINEHLKSASSVEEALEATSDALNFCMSGEKLFNINPAQFELVQTSVESCLRNFDNCESLDHYIKILKKDKGYLIAHSITTLHLCFMVMKKSGLYSSENMERLTYASLLHDCELPDYQNSLIIDKSNETFSALDKKQQDAVLSHPLLAAEHILKVANIPVDVEAIIRMHHEKPDGSGYPRGLNRNSFSVLSALFVLCLRLADHLYYNEDDKNKLNEFISVLEETYSTGAFKTPWEALSKIIS